ncbi:transmembrane protein [Cystoisospora suis]|uniref:Transmembrane protein n=1 Tax=Cystoisospora suis TaxID=483139 RepID=A0A2C6JD59_9APIC|nr:transmembrane protein [Cystoisospora suis]
MGFFMKSFFGLDLASWVALVSLYSLVSATIELCSETRRTCQQSGTDSLSTFNFTSSAFTIFAGSLGILSTIFYSSLFVVFVIVAVFITALMDVAEIITNATSPHPSTFQYILTSLHLAVTVIALIILFSYYSVLKAGGTGREYRATTAVKRTVQQPFAATEESRVRGAGGYGATSATGRGGLVGP